MVAQMNSVEVFDRNDFPSEGVMIKEKLSEFNRMFRSSVAPEKGIYGATMIDKGNGRVDIRGKSDSGHPFIETFQDGKLKIRRESLGNHRIVRTDYDEKGVAYLKTYTSKDANRIKEVNWELQPNTTITKGNFTAQIDAYGRPIRHKVTDLKLKDGGYHPVSKFKDSSYREGDEAGHAIPDQFGGPASKENTYAQAREVNRGTGSKIRKVENLAAQLKKEGHKVDYEIKTNYSGTKNKRPTSFEPKITVDGSEYELSCDLRKIYNAADDSMVNRTILAAKEKFGTVHEMGTNSALTAAELTFVLSGVDHITACINGEITGEEAALGILTDTAASGGLAYGTEFISTSVSQVMKGSSKALLRKIGNSCLPAAAVSFAVDSFDSISNFATGKIDGLELTYELGDSATAVAGGMAGMKAGGSLGTVIGGAPGGVIGGIVGGTIGTIMASEAYATAVEAGADGIQYLAEKAEQLSHDVVETVTKNIPEKLEEVKEALSNFIEENNLPFSI